MGWLRSTLAVLALSLNLGGIYGWWRYPPAGLSELRAQALHDEARRARVEKRFIEARHRFRFAAERYPDAIFGERSAYLQALVAMDDIGDLAGAKAGFEAYLSRYPQGIFVARAKERLAFLSEIPAEPQDAGQRFMRAENLIAADRLEEAETLLLDLERRGLSGAFGGRVRARLNYVRAQIVGRKS